MEITYYSLHSNYTLLISFQTNKYNLLQKNNYRNNDLFVQPIDISDNNLPNGNSIYLLVCNKLKNITLENYDLELIDMKIIKNFERIFIKRYHNKIYKTNKQGDINYDDHNHPTNVKPLDFSITKLKNYQEVNYFPDCFL